MTGKKFLNAEVATRASLRIFLGIFLLAPYLVWLMWISSWNWPSVQEWWGTLETAFIQAGLSAVCCMLIGFLFFMAAQGWKSARMQRASEIALLLPNVVPPLFLILAILSWVTPWMAFPYGFTAVVFAHVLLNSGLVAVSLNRLFHAKLGGMAETAWVFGASRTLFLRKVALPFLKTDLACMFLFVFSLSFTSFSIPLVLGGEKLVTLEVAIFDSIRMEGRWDKAVILAAIQSLILFLLAWSLPHNFWPKRQAQSSLDYFALKGFRLLVFIPAFLLVVGWISGALLAFRSNGFEVPWVEPLLNSLALGVSVGILNFILFLLTAYVSPHPGLSRFLSGYLAPSPAIVGFAMLLLPGEGEIFNFVKLSVALTLILFPLLYRWTVHSALSSLRDQILTARTLGADWSLILFDVVWPQVAPQLLRASGLAALWASGDFAISGIVAGEMHTVPLVMENLLSNYRIESAQLLMFPLALAGLALYGLFTGAARYVSR